MDEYYMPKYRKIMPTPSIRCPAQFAIPLNPLGLSFFDTDPSRILALLYHQTYLAEETMRYHGFNSKDHLRHNLFMEIFAKEKERLFKRDAQLFKKPIRTLYTYEHISKDLSGDVQDNHRKGYNQYNMQMNKKSQTVQKSDQMGPDKEDKRSTKSPTDTLNKPLSLIFEEPMNTTELSNKEKSPISSTSSSPTIKPIPESLLMQELIEEETQCIACNATFPSVWLLEQHSALQHANLGSMEEKPFICDQCGQSYRYRSAYVKHREQNHRARLPADKLFTCDVCGMQFRYLKSFKKHRLNHALERLHGKNEKRGIDMSNEEVSSSNETLTASEEAELQYAIKTEKEGEYQDDTIDSQMAMCVDPPYENVQLVENQPKLNNAEACTSSTTSKNVTLKQPFAQNNEPESIVPSTSVNSLINAERLPREQVLGLNSQEVSMLNFLRADAAEKQRDRRFACPFCEKCVRSKENLKLHVRKHTGERPFVCLFCGRAFGGKSDLTRHLRIHTGERPYHCEACGKCFARADYLSKHLTTHMHTLR